MATRFFLCNLKVYNEIYIDILNAKKNFNSKLPYKDRWTCGNMVNIAIGDKAYFLRVGDDIRGIFASGEIIKPPTNGAITFQWNAVVDFDNPLLVSKLLQQQNFDGANFALRGSGYRFSDKYTNALDIAWRQHVIQFGCTRR